jgi:phage tail protein X
MQSRYKNSRFKNTIDGREVLQSKIYPNIPKTDDDIYVATETGDRFDTLAYQFYKDSTLWWIIACANNIHNANIGIKEGTILRIPQNYIDVLRDFEQ